MAKRWTADEKEYLKAKWGEKSVDSIARHLGRTRCSIMNCARRSGLPRQQDNQAYVSLHKLAKVLGRNGSDGYLVTSWIEKRGLKCKILKTKSTIIRLIKIADFWEWAYVNQDFLTFEKFEKFRLGKEPKWVEAKRASDIQKSLKMYHHKERWTKNDDEKLEHYLLYNKYDIKEIAKMLCRSESAVTRRAYDIGIACKLMAKSKHEPWKQEEIVCLKEMIVNGTNYCILSATIKRKSEKAIRGMVYRIYGTENLDKARKQQRAEYDRR